MSGIQNNTAVANTILNLLAASETNYEYPTLQKNAVDIISTNLSDSIYSTLKQKSIASCNKRCNLLKFLNNMCKTPEFHLEENHYKIYLKGYEKEFHKTNCPELEDLSHKISRELEESTVDVHRDVVNFYKRKNGKRKNKIKILEFIRQLDQEKLGPDMQSSRNVSHYETSQCLIDELLKEEKHLVVTKPDRIQRNSKEYREKQVQFCYALVNIAKDHSDMKMLESILQRYSAYKLLESFETNLLINLWVLGECNNVDLSKIITENYPFIIEKLIIQFCTNILSLSDGSEVVAYFSNLSTNPEIRRLRDVCTKNLTFYYRVKNLIFELYVFSYCNENVYKFSDYII